MAYPDAAASLPEYQCHKVVRAMQIAQVNWMAGGAELIGYNTISVGIDYMTKHQPKVGGYYVAYDDGYESWSPSEAFEAGYTKL
jgi:hypothetical protein